ncbi:MAG: HIT domain-containing protein [Patescibacteria group bacterium]
MNKNQSVFTTLPEIKERKITENDTAFAFLTNTPINPGHTLVSPKRVVATSDELTDKELLDIFKLVSQIKKVLKKAYGAEGFNCAWNEGKDYGQSVPHFHLHIVPRTPNDDGIDEYEPRKFLYRPGSRQESPEAELAAAAKDIRKQF